MNPTVSTNVRIKSVGLIRCDFMRMDFITTRFLLVTDSVFQTPDCVIRVTITRTGKTIIYSTKQGTSKLSNMRAQNFFGM